MYGPQGSGKGTQAKLLASKLGLIHLSSGEILRTESKRKTTLGRFLARQLKTGILTPIDKLMKVFDSAISRVPAKEGIVFDGFARQITEAKIYLKRLKKIGRAIDAVILVNISTKETLKRLSKRAECENCRRVLILGTKFKIGGKCPSCGGKIVRRSDDEPAAIAKRLRLYRKRTLPVIRHFKKEKLLTTINGEQSIEKVHRDIIAALKKRKLAK